jgi:hypothetical protein
MSHEELEYFFERNGFRYGFISKDEICINTTIRGSCNNPTCNNRYSKQYYQIFITGPYCLGCIRRKVNYLNDLGDKINRIIVKEFTKH